MTSARARTVLLASFALFAGACGDPGTTPTKATDAPAASTSSSARVALPGVDTSALTPRERRELEAQLGELKAPCPGMDVTIAQCLSEKKECKVCLPAASFVAREVRTGKPKKDREQSFKERFDPALVKKIDVGDGPTKGPESAVVTIVEWADFECPACLAMSPYLDRLVERFPGQVRLAYRNYPLTIHKNGEIAARGGIAAFKQGKFWEMHHKLFENQEHNDRRTIEKLAKDLELDITKFKADLTDADTTARLERDKAQASELGLSATPFIFINGRELKPEGMASFEDDLEAWVKLDIELAGQTPAAPSPKWKEMTGAEGSATPAGSAAPSASASAGPAASGSAAPAAGSAAPSATASPAPKGSSK